MNGMNELENYAHEHHVPIIMEEGLQFLLQQIAEKHVKTVLEIGTAIGYSAICMAKLDPAIRIDTLEIDPERYAKAQCNIEKQGLSAQISVYLTDALEFFPTKQYDLIFVDAAKSQYRRYMEHFIKNLAPNGFYFFDNLNFHGFVDDPSLTQNRSTRQMCAKIKRFREWIQNDPGLNTCFYPQIGDGIAVVSVKKGQNMIE